MSVLLVAALGLSAVAAIAQDPQQRHNLDELALRRGDKPWVRLFADGQFPTERTIFRDSITGAEVWRLTDDPREDRHDYYDIPVWNSDGTAMILIRENDVVPNRQWFMPADASWMLPVADFSEDFMLGGEGKLETAPKDNFWSWADPSRMYNLTNGVVSIINPLHWEKIVLFDLMESPIVADPDLPALVKEDFVLMPPHPLDDRLLFHTAGKGRIFSLDIAALELYEIPTDGRWEMPGNDPGVVGIHRLRWTKEPDQYRIFIGQDNRSERGLVIPDSRQYIATMDGQLTDYNLEAYSQRGGHPDITIEGNAITATYNGSMWMVGIDGVTPTRLLFEAKTTQHHSSCTWDGRWLAVDNGRYEDGPGPVVLRGFDVEQSIVLTSLDGRVQNVLNYPYSSYAVDESTHPGPTSSPDGTKIVYDSDMLDRAVGGGGDLDGNPDLWMVVVRPPGVPRDVASRANTVKVKVSWQPPLHADQAFYWNPGNESREIRGYNVLRGLTTGGPYQQLNDLPITSDSYFDTTVESGVSYYYVVQSVEHSGLASLYSEEVFGSTTSRRWQGDVIRYYEAENADMTLPMVPQIEPGTTSGDWFAGTFAMEPDPVFPLEPGPAALTFDVYAPLGARYTLWAKVKAYGASGSVDVEVDGVLASDSLLVESGDWVWTSLPNVVRLRGGSHTIELSMQDENIGIDMLALSFGIDGEPPPFGNGDMTAPTPPSDARLVSIDGNTKQIVWSPSTDSDVAYYNVYCGRDASYPLGNANILRSPRATSVFDWGIPNGLETVYKITAVDRYGNESEPIVFDPGVQTEESAPVAGDDTYSINEDVVLDVPALGVLANDIDDDGDTLTAEVVTGVENGVLELAADGGFTYTPNVEFAGVDQFTYTANDEVSTSNISTVTINIAVVNDPPIALPDAYSTDEEVNLTVLPIDGVLVNDSDAEGVTLSSILVTSTQHGTMDLSDTGVIHYWPDDDFNGTDSFTYKASDGVSTSNVVTVTLTVNPVEDLPDANTDEYVVNEDTALEIPEPGVLANDVDVDGDVLQAVLQVGPTNGAVDLRANGGFIYLPNANFQGFDTFTYVVTDGKGSSTPAEVRITVTDVNDLPVAADDAFQVPEDGFLEIEKPGVLANDTDPDGTGLEALLVSGVNHGTLTLKTNGKLIYRPDDDFEGVETLTYRASDGVASSNLATVTIVVTPVNDAPTSENDVFATDEDTVLDIAALGVLANDGDIDGDTLMALLVTSPANGTIDLRADGRLIYSPNPNFAGTEFFTYLASDGKLDSPEAQIRIDVQKVNDAPVALPDAYVTPAGTILEIAPPGLLVNDSDVDDTSLTSVLVGDVARGTLALKGSGSIRYVPEDGFHGTVSFTYQAWDGDVGSIPVTVTLTVE